MQFRLDHLKPGIKRGLAMVGGESRGCCFTAQDAEMFGNGTRLPEATHQVLPHLWPSRACETGQRLAVSWPGM